MTASRMGFCDKGNRLMPQDTVIGSTPFLKGYRMVKNNKTDWDDT